MSIGAADLRDLQQLGITLDELKRNGFLASPQELVEGHPIQMVNLAELIDAAVAYKDGGKGPDLQ
jgi:hypothetical protein